MFPDLTSNLGVPPRQQFRLGGGQPGKFFVDILNTGTVAATIRVDRAGTIEDLGIAEPGATVRHQFAAGEGAIIVNRSEQEASLRVKVWGNINIAMRYTPAEEAPGHVGSLRRILPDFNRPLALHPRARNHRHIPHARVKPVSIARRQTPAAQLGELRQPMQRIEHASRKSPAPVRLFNDHITQPRERGRIGHDTSIPNLHARRRKGACHQAVVHRADHDVTSDLRRPVGRGQHLVNALWLHRSSQGGNRVGHEEKR